MNYLLVQSLGCFLIAANGLPQSATVDPADPNKADPSAIPDMDFAIPQPRTPKPFMDTVPILPDVCDSSNLTEGCFKTLENDGQGAYLWFERGHGCTDDQQEKIKQGFWDAQDLLRYAAKWSAERSSRDLVSADYWIGPNWRDYASRLKGNLERASGFVNNKGNRKSYITMTCQDPKGYCKRGRLENKAIGGYAWNVDWAFWTYGHINMCDPYYSLTDISGKIEDLNDFRREGAIEKLQDMRYYQTYGQFLAHEMMHFRSIYHPEPKISDSYLWGATGEFQNDVRAYGPNRVHQLARGDASGSADQSGGKVSTVNADSYTLFINSIFWWDVTQYFPGVPGKKAGSSTLDLAPPMVVFPTVFLDNSDDVSIESINDHMADAIDSYMRDDDLVEEPQDQTDELDPKPVASVADRNSCHGISGDYWVMSRDTAIENVASFCGQAEQTKTYNEGSVNELELSVKSIHDDGKGPMDAPDCVARFSNAVIDGCDGNEATNNPHNYKFGSTFTTGDGWEYKMTPLSKQVNEVNCKVSWKVFFDSFEIRGKNFPDAKLGINGEGLEDELSGCGALTKWKFERASEDDDFQWYAAGQLPVFTKACIGRAIQSAGGSDDSSCKGNGKRRAVGSDSIDSWPGYGDESKHVFKDSSSM